jgi:serpin B
VLAAAVLALLTACGSSSSAGGGALAQSNLPRNTDPSVSTTDLATLTAGDNTFALAMFGTQPDGANLFFSPYSISSALAMTYAGANGATATQMATALDFTLPAASLHPAFDALDLALASRATAAGSKPGFQLKLANALWAQQGKTFQPTFLNTLATDYGAGVRLLDFADAPDAARTTINNWVASQTADKITNLIPSGELTSAVRFVLTNAVYFLAPWSSQFNAANTANGTFTRLDGSTVTVPLMHQGLLAAYSSGANWQAVDLPYADGSVAMTVVLPASGQLSTVEQSLSAAWLQSVISAEQLTEVTLTLPKWTQSTTLSLKTALSQLGMTTAFDPTQADFSGIDGAKDLFIGAVNHQAVVTVDETGTEAAAATSVVGVGTAAPAQSATMTVNQSFLFFIRDVPTGQIVFLGRTVDPTAG